VNSLSHMKLLPTKQSIALLSPASTPGEALLKKAGRGHGLHDMRLLTDRRPGLAGEKCRR